MSLAKKADAPSAKFLSRLFKPKRRDAQPSPENFLKVPAGINLVHVTHWKAGSQWMADILHRLYGPGMIRAENFEQQVLGRPIVPERVYTCVYLSKPEFDTVVFPPGSRRFVIIRDLRDTMVSAYFSFRYSHVVNNPVMERRRNILNRLSHDDGMTHIMEFWMNGWAMIQRSWIKSGEPVYRLEDCMLDARGTVETMLKTSWGLTVDPALLDKVIRDSSFEKLSGGRERGKEDIHAHYRKGSAGDWQNHFTPAIKDRFKTLFQDVLVMGRYEKDDKW